LWLVWYSCKLFNIAKPTSPVPITKNEFFI
jgi:hypothetical protein